MAPSEGTLGKKVLEQLTDAIVDGELAGGTRHSEKELAARWNVSRTPVREALVVLEQRGMVRFERNKGVRVNTTPNEAVYHIFEMRLWLEPPATRKAVHNLKPSDLVNLREEFKAMHEAAVRHDVTALWRHERAFHFRILNASGNSRCATYVDSLRELQLLRAPSTLSSALRSFGEIVDDHGPLLEAIEAGDAALAETAMRWHIRRTAQLVAKAMESTGAKELTALRLSE